MSGQIWSAEVAGDTVCLAGEIDYTVTPDVRSFLLEQMKQAVEVMKLDLTKLEYLDSSGLAILIELRRVLLENKKQLTITEASPQVRKLFLLTQVAELFGLS